VLVPLVLELEVLEVEVLELVELRHSSWCQLLVLSKVVKLHSWQLHFHQELVKRYLGIQP